MDLKNENGFRKYLKGRGLNPKDINTSIEAVKEFKDHLKKKKSSFENASLGLLKNYISLLIEEGRNSEERLISLARYSYYAKKNDFYVHFASIAGAVNVLPDIGERLAIIGGEETRRKVYGGIEFPPLGAPQDDYPRLTKAVLDGMESGLTPRKCREVMTWNYHKIPATAFREAKERFEKSTSIDEYLRGEHQRLVEELEGCMRTDRLWYEQEITPEVLEFVKSNQEVNTGLRKDNRIFKVKIPYAPKLYLKEKDSTMKKYYACHCQLVRTSLRDGSPEISPTFCYCSAGYEKLHFDVIFDEPVEVELLETLLKGDPRCRFAIKIPKGKMK